MHSGQWSVTKPLRSFSNIETFLDFLNAFGHIKTFFRVRAILEQDLHAKRGQYSEKLLKMKGFS